MSRRKAKNKGKSQKTVVQEPGVISIEKLPLPYVNYPDGYGSFLAYQETKDSTLYFCDCFRDAIENFLILGNIIIENKSSSDFILFPNINEWTKREFPKLFIEQLSPQNIQASDELLSYVNYKAAICHECNRKTPIYRYCPDAYGSSFKQNYGWFINKQAYEYGIYPHHSVIRTVFLEEACPEELLDFVEISDIEVSNINIKINAEFIELQQIDYYEALQIYNKAREAIWEKVQNQRKKIMREIENFVRGKFGYKKIGESWINETMLYQIICKLFPEQKVLHHHKPAFLQGLELDIYLPEKRIGVEYQGIQHFKPIKHWGGEDALEQLKIRDKKKKKLCEDNDVSLIYFYYDEILSDELVLSKINNKMLML